MEKVVITGGAGFIGSHLARVLEGRFEVLCYDDLSTGSRDNLSGIGCDLVEGSLADRASLERHLEGATYLFHLAGMTSVAYSMNAPKKCEELNVLGLLNVLEACVSRKVEKVIFASSASVYGVPNSSRCVETDRPRPQSPYAVTKLAGEHYLDLYRQSHGLASASLRLFNVYGLRQSALSEYASVVPLFFKNALNGYRNHIFGDGEQTRDFIHVGDVARMMLQAAQQGDVFGSLNVGTGRGISILALNREINRLVGCEREPIFAEERPGDIRTSVADVSRARRFGMEATTSLTDGLSTIWKELVEPINPVEVCP